MFCLLYLLYALAKSYVLTNSDIALEHEVDGDLILSDMGQVC